MSRTELKPANDNVFLSFSGGDRFAYELLM